MSVHSVDPVPIQTKWFQRYPSANHLKEVMGGITLFHRHCSTFMRRVITYERSDEGVRKIGCNSWICVVCEKREYDPGDM